MALTRPRYSQIYDTDYKQSVRLATTADVGNLVAGFQTNTVDGKTVVLNDRILVKDQANTMQNGIYYVTVVGTGSNGTWARTVDANANDKVTSGLTTVVTEGSVNGGKEFRLTTPDPIFLGNTGLTFTNPFATAGAGGANTYVQFNDASTLNGSSAFTFNKYSNVVTVGGSISAGNITAGNLITTAAGQFSGIFDESSTTSGIFVGNAGSGTPSPRVGFFNGNSLQNWQVDNYFGTFRWFTPGISQMTLNSSGILGVTTVNASGNVIAAVHSGGQVNVTGVINTAGNILAAGATIGAANVTGLLAASGVTQITNTTNATGGVSGALQVSGGAYVAKDLWVTGNIYAGNLMSTVANVVTIQDNLLYLNRSNVYPYNYSVGLYSHYIGGPANAYVHTAITRQPNDNTWWFLSNIAEPSPATGNINVYDTNAILDNIVAGNINLVGNVSAAVHTGGAITVTGYINTSANLSAANGVFGTITSGGLINTLGNVIATSGVYNSLTVNGNITVGSLANPGGTHTLLGNVNVGASLSGTQARFNVTPLVATAYASGYTYAAKFLSFTNTAKGVNLGYDDTLDAGIIAVEYGGNPWRPLYINPQGANVLIGTVSVGVGNVTIGYTTPSTSTTTGALQVTGGVGVGGNIYQGGNPATTDNSTQVATTNFVRTFGGFQAQVVYTNATQAFANTSATFPVGVTKAKITVVAGGGAGGGNPAGQNQGGGGGGGGGQSVSYITFASGAQYWANVGAGGVAVSAANGGTGNVSTFTVSGTITNIANGGAGGLVGIAGTQVGGAGGTATTGNITLTGTAGGASTYGSATAGQGASGAGAPGYMGTGGGIAVRQAAAGSAAGNVGAVGGGGSGSIGGAATATVNIGGNGGGGIIIIEY